MKFGRVWMVIAGFCVIGLAMSIAALGLQGVWGLHSVFIASVGLVVGMGASEGRIREKRAKGERIGTILGAIIAGFIGFFSGGVGGLLGGLFIGVFGGNLIGGLIGEWADKKKGKGKRKKQKKGRELEQDSTPSSSFQDKSEKNAQSELDNTSTADEKGSQYTSKKDIYNRISQLKEEEKMIDTREIEDALEEGETGKAEELLKELEKKYHEYEETLNELKQLDQRKGNLANQLAEKEIDRDTYNDAKREIEHQKADLEEKLNKLRKEVIHEDYEKPF